MINTSCHKPFVDPGIPEYKEDTITGEFYVSPKEVPENLSEE